MKKRTSTPPKITDGQETKFRRLVEDSAKIAAELAIKKVRTDEAGWQKVIEHGDKLREAIVKAIILKVRRLSVSDMTNLFDDHDDTDPFEKHGVSRT